ncbi:MAG: zinc-finger-containing protein [Marvinbryantia sp.]|uniref:zinc-finger-containing protein n=1 Tax=Marvinbryantia sp. TaxID=2496532 RepID=UPI00399BF3F8
MAKRKKERQKPVICPYCGRTAVLRPAAYVYGKDNLDPEGYLYVCSGYPACDAYVGVHKKSMRPKGTLADGELRNKRIKAHHALDALWKEGYMTRHGAYIWLQYRLNLRERDMHIGMFSTYLCGETIRECTEFMEKQQECGKGGKNIGTGQQITA